MPAPKHAFSKEMRLLAASEFQHVFRQASIRVGTGEILLLCRPVETQARLGLVIAKKHVRKAHERNRIKRLARESFRLHHEEIPPLDIIFLAKKGLDQLDNKKILSAINQLWKRVGRKYQPPKG